MEKVGNKIETRHEGYYSKLSYPYQLRRIEVWDDKNREVIVLLTNHFYFGATTIASIYKDRWQIEIFFKTIKQNLKIKTFVRTSPNALMIQISDTGVEVSEIPFQVWLVTQQPCSYVEI